MNFKRIALYSFLLIIPVFFFTFFGCSNNSNPSSGRGTSDDDIGPPVDDDFSDDAADDDNNDDAADDDQTDDDQADDDTNPGELSVTIIKPEDKSVLNSPDVDILIQYSGATSVTIYLDGIDITYSLTSTSDEYFGEIPDQIEGQHTLEALASNGIDSISATSDFSIDLSQPYIDMELSATQIIKGESVTATIHVYDGLGHDVTDQTNPTLSVSPMTGVTIDGYTITFNNKGVFEVTAEADWGDQHLTDTDTVSVVDNLDYTIVVTLSSYQIQAGDTVQGYADVRNSEGNPVTVPVIWSVLPPQGATVNGNYITLTKAGDDIKIRGTIAGTNIYDEATIQVLPGLPAKINLELSAQIVVATATVSYTMTVMDQYNNPVTNDNPTLTVDPMTGVHIDTGASTIEFVWAGIFTVTATSEYGSFTDSKNVTVKDESQPTIQIDYPDRGTWNMASSIDYSGTVIDEHSDITSLKLNGTPLTLYPGNTFFGSIPAHEGVNILKFEAVDTYDNKQLTTRTVLRGGKWPKDTPIDKGIGARINQETLDLLDSIIEDYVNNLDLMSFLPPNPVVSGDINGPWGIWLGSYAVDILSITKTPLNLSIIPQSDGLHLTGSFSSLSVGIRVYGSLPIVGGYDESGTATANNVSVTARIVLGASGGNLTVTIADLNVSIGSINIDFLGFLGDLLGYLIDAFKSFIEDELESILMEQLPPLIDNFLQDLDLSASFELMPGYQFNFNASFDSVLHDTEGVTLWLDPQISSAVHGGVQPEFDGSYWSDHPQPLMNHFIPGTSTPYGFGFVVSDEILNQALFELYRSGILSQDITSDLLNTSILGILMPQFLQIAPNAPVIMRLRPLLPPIFHVGPIQDEKALETSLQWGDLILEFWVDVPNVKEEVEAFKVAVAMIVPIALSIDPTNNKIHITFDTANWDFNADLFEEPTLDFNDTVVENWIPGIVELILPFLANLIGEIPIPSFSGYTIIIDGLESVGEGEDWAGFYGHLIESSSEMKYDKIMVPFQRLNGNDVVKTIFKAKKPDLSVRK